MRVVAVTSYLPSPLDRGDPVRVDMYLRALNEISDLTVLATERDDTSIIDVDMLAKRLPGATIHTYPPAMLRSTRRLALSRWFASILKLTPSWIANRASPEIRRFLASNADSYDYCFLLGEAAGQYSSIRTTARLHWDKSNVLTASTRGDISESAPWTIGRIRLILISMISRRYEARVLSNIHQVSVTSRAEADRLRQFQGRIPDFVHPSAIEPVFSNFEVSPESKTVLWMGSFQYHSNTNGLIRFLERGLPVLRENGYTLRLVGSGASDAMASKLRATPGVDYMGFVPDLSTAIEDVKAAVIPLWSGAGVKIKTLTLMRLGLPVVGTETAFEGIDPAAALGLTELPESMAEKCITATDKDLKSAQDRASREIEDNFTEQSFFARVSSQVLPL